MIAAGPGLVKPLYVYAMGSQLCSTQVQMADSTIDWAPSFVQCFYQLPQGHDAIALSFHVYADLLFFSDDQDGAIHRMQMETNSGNSSLLQIAANTGSVKGNSRLRWDRRSADRGTLWLYVGAGFTLCCLFSTVCLRRGGRVV